MSSPFRYFRRHTKAFMAVAAVVCMFLFVFASAIGSGGPSSGDQRSATAEVATWDGGSINEGELASLVSQRLITNEFLRMLFAQGGGQTEYDVPQNLPSFLVPPDRIDLVENEVIMTELFADMAEKAGISVSDDMVNHYIQEWGLGRVDTADVQGILANMRAGNERSNEAVVYDTIRKGLLAYFYRRGYEDAGAVVLPEQRWEDWRRINEKISLSAAVLPVEKLVAEVPEPTEAQLTSLYKEFSDKEPDMVYVVGTRELPSPNPGFAVPRRIALQYLVGNLAARTLSKLSSVTDAEIADYYERNKRAEFTKDDDELADFDDEEEADADAAAEEAPASEGSEDAATGTDPATTEEAPADDASGDAPGAAETPAAEAPAANEPTGETPASEAPAADAPAAGADPAPGEGDQSSVARRSPFRLAALQTAPAADDPSDAADQTATEASNPPADAAAEETVPGADATAGPAQDEAAAAGEAADATAAETEKPAEGAATTGDSAAAGAEADDAAPAEPPIEFVPLEEVREQIRERLAEDKAVEELQRHLGEAAVKLQTEYNQYGRKVVENRELKREAPEPPAKLKDLKWVADEYGLELRTTESLSLAEMFETPVGKAADDQTGRISVTQAVFGSLELYEPFVAKEPQGDWYLVLKTADVPRRVPPFSEVRDQVAVAWKHREAAKLAEKKAKELADAAEESTESFEQFFRSQGYDVIPQTGLFSWREYLIGAGMGYPAELSDVPELEHVGPEFMDAAFKLDGNETVGMLNFDHSAAYVFRLHSRQYTPEELQKLFLKETNTWLGNRDMMGERYSVFRRAVENKLAKDVAGFKFNEEWERRREQRLAERN